MTSEYRDASAGLRYVAAAINADESVPAIHVLRDFAATPEQLMRAHTDPAQFAAWVGPDGTENHILEWDPRDGGAWSYRASRPGYDTYFRGCFHTVSRARIVQTFAWEELPGQVALETLTFTDLGYGRTRLHSISVSDSFEGRDAWLGSGMSTGVHAGYAKLDALLAGATVR